jgi:hypothetical protein
MGKKYNQILLQFDIELEKICENVFSSTFHNKLFKKNEIVQKATSKYYLKILRLNENGNWITRAYIFDFFGQRTSKAY